MPLNVLMLHITNYLIELAGQEGNVPAEGDGHDAHHQDQARTAPEQGGDTAHLGSTTISFQVGEQVIVVITSPTSCEHWQAPVEATVNMPHSHQA